MLVYPQPRRSLGGAATVVGSAVPLAVTGLTVGTSIAAAGATAAGGAAAGATIGSTIPIVGTIIGAAIGTVLGLLSSHAAGAAQRKVVVGDVNQAEQYLKANLASFQAGQIDKTSALTYFDSVWAQMPQICALPSAGSGCMADRSAGGKWDWFAYYRTPIANTPDTTTVGAVEGLFTSSAGEPNYLLIGGLAVLALGVML